jgi:ribosomal protein S18 acetylase RimI-like enzyme
MEALFGDQEVVADLLTGYYTDYEPSSLWVAEHEGKVVGYLSGALDSRRYIWTMVRRLIPQIAIKSIIRGALWRPEAWGILMSGMTVLRLGGFHRHAGTDTYPAHLHVNVDKEFRSMKVGQLLMGRFLEQVKGAGLAGVHASVREDSPDSRRFFERLGFVEMERYPTIGPDSRKGRIAYVIVYGKELTS